MGGVEADGGHGVGFITDGDIGHPTIGADDGRFIGGGVDIATIGAGSGHERHIP